MKFYLSPFALEHVVLRDRFGQPVPSQHAQSPHSFQNMVLTFGIPLFELLFFASCTFLPYKKSKQLSTCRNITLFVSTVKPLQHITFERCSQLAVFAIQPDGSDAASACWLIIMVFTRCASFEQHLIWCPPGGGATREAGGTVAESLINQGSTYQIRQRQRAALFSTSHGNAEPLCARIKGASREVSEGTADI